MLKKIFIFILTFSWIFLSPLTTLAESCTCMPSGSCIDMPTGATMCSPSDCPTGQTGTFNTADCQATGGFCHCNNGCYSTTYTDCSIQLPSRACSFNNTACPSTDGFCHCNNGCYSTSFTDCSSQLPSRACSFDNTACAASTTTDSGFSYSSVQDNVQIKPPNLEIKIPGLSFTQLASTIDEQGNISIPYLGDYIASVYRFAVIAASLVAVIMIIINGFRIVVSAGGEDKAAGVKGVGRALVGLFILWSSYLLLYTINPNLTSFKSVKVKYVPPHTVEEEEEFAASAGAAVTTAELKTPIISNVVVAPGVQISSNLVDSLQTVATTLANQGISLYVSSGYRSIDNQIALINQNCQNPPGSDTCNPKAGRPLTCILRGYKADGSNQGSGCPHTTGKAVDVWGMMDGMQCVSQKSCKKNASDPCHANSCQAAVIKAMRDAGFCNLDSEAWHFEQPKMSNACH